MEGPSLWQPGEKPRGRQCLEEPALPSCFPPFSPVPSGRRAPPPLPPSGAPWRPRGPSPAAAALASPRRPFVLLPSLPPSLRPRLSPSPGSLPALPRPLPAVSPAPAAGEGDHGCCCRRRRCRRRRRRPPAEVMPAMEPPSLLPFLRKLKEVFDVCDEDADGFIRVEHFVALGLQFGQGEEVRRRRMGMGGARISPGSARPGPVHLLLPPRSAPPAPPSAPRLPSGRLGPAPTLLEPLGASRAPPVPQRGPAASPRGVPEPPSLRAGRSPGSLRGSRSHPALMFPPQPRLRAVPAGLRSLSGRCLRAGGCSVPAEHGPERGTGTERAAAPGGARPSGRPQRRGHQWGAGHPHKERPRSRAEPPGAALRHRVEPPGDPPSPLVSHRQPQAAPRGSVEP